MSDVSKILRQKVLQAVAEERQKPQQTVRRHAEVLAEFIRVQLSRLKMKEGEFAQLIVMSRQETRLLLEATLPNEALTDEVLERIATALQCDVKLMRIILNRDDLKQTFTKG